MPKNYGQINPDYCSKLHASYNQENGQTEFPEPWSNSNCYFFYDKSFESQIKAQVFCRKAFGYKYVGELAYGIGNSNFSSINSTDSHPRWKYQKLGILDENSTCQCITNDYEYIALKNDTLCPMPRQNHCYGTLYDVSTVCVIEKISDYKKEALEDLFFSRRHDPRSRYLQRAVCKQRGWEC